MVKKIQTIRKIGNSSYIVVPKSTLELLNLQVGDDIEVTFRGLQNDNS